MPGARFDPNDPFINADLLEFFKKKGDKSFSETEVRQEFGDAIAVDLTYLYARGHLEMTYAKGDLRYQLKLKKS